MRYRTSPLAALALAALLLHGTAHAGVQSTARSEARVRVAPGPVITKADPNDRWLRQADGFTVLSGVENFTSVLDPWTGNPTAATARASFSLEAGLPRMQLLTAIDPGAFAYTEAGGQLTITGTLTGTPGARGLVTFEGAFLAAVAMSAGTPQGSSGAEVDFSAGLTLTGAGQAACRFQRCLASDRLSEQFANGSLPANGLAKPFSLSLEATVGDRLELSFIVAATAANGYFVLIGQPSGVPLQRTAAFSLNALAAPDDVAGIHGIRLTNGLGLSADTGLELRADGLWVAPAPVPEPVPAWLLGIGLAWLWLRRRLSV